MTTATEINVLKQRILIDNIKGPLKLTGVEQKLCHTKTNSLLAVYGLSERKASCKWHMSPCTDMGSETDGQLKSLWAGFDMKQHILYTLIQTYGVIRLTRPEMITISFTLLTQMLYLESKHENKYNNLHLQCL